MKEHFPFQEDTLKMWICWKQKTFRFWTQDSFKILDKGLLYTGLISATTAFMFFLFPELSISILFGNKYLPAVPLLRLFSLAMVPLALINIIMNFNLARERMGFIYSFIGFSILEVILIGMFHSSLNQVLLILIGVLTTLFTINIGLVWVDRRRAKVTVQRQIEKENLIWGIHLLQWLQEYVS